MSFFPPWLLRLNELFGPEEITNLSVDDLPDRSLPLKEGLQALGVDAAGVDTVLANFPEAHLFALRGVVESAIGRGVPVSFAWLPGYDNELTISEWADQPGEPCGITVVVRSRHESDVRVPTG